MYGVKPHSDCYGYLCHFLYTELASRAEGNTIVQEGLVPVPTLSPKPHMHRIPGAGAEVIPLMRKEIVPQKRIIWSCDGHTLPVPHPCPLRPSSAATTSTPRASKPKEKVTATLLTAACRAQLHSYLPPSSLSPQPKLTPQERLKKKMQAQLSKQCEQHFMRVARNVSFTLHCYESFNSRCH